MPARPETDRNLLFGILALQMDFIDQGALVAAMQSWVFRKDAPLGQILVEQGVLGPERRTLLEALVQEHLKQHGNDPEKSLAAVSSVGSVRQQLERIADPDVLASLATIPPAGDDPDATSFPSAAPAADPYATCDPSPRPPGAAPLRYRILRPHAKGGLGEVFVAHDEELHREVALKEIQDRHADHPESRTRFLLEAEITGGLEHPGIVPVYGLGTYADGRPYYAMRFIKGDSLKDAIERFHKTDVAGRDPGERALALRQLLRRYVDVCNAIAYAHSPGVLHRDLKPGNIMLGQYGETLVVDWGLAKPLGHRMEKTGEGERTLLPRSASGSAATEVGSALGTPAFMSPEQAAGRLDELGPASDVYSLGATLYCLLTGKLPIEEPDVRLVLWRVQAGEFPRPRWVKPKVPAALEAVCLKAMALKPADRYAGPRGLADDVEHWLADEPVSAWREPWRVKARRWAGRHRSWVTAGVASLVVAAIGLGVGLFVLNAANERERSAKEKETVAREKAERNLYFSQIHLAERAWDDGDVARVRELLRGHEQDDSDLRGFEWHYLWRLCHSDFLTFKGPRGIRNVCLSPDGQYLAGAFDFGTLKVWDARTGQEVLVLKGHTREVRSVCFSPDGQRLASASRNQTTVRLWDTRTGQEVLVLKGHTREVSSVCFSPDGQRLASASADRTVKVWDARTGQEALTLKGHTREVSSVCFSPDGQRLASASVDRTVKVWDARTGQEALSLKGHTREVSSVCFSPDGQCLASASADRTVKVWDARTGQEALSLKGHTSSVTSVCFSPDSQRLASASYDASVKVWDARTGQEALSLEGHTNTVTSLFFFPDGRRLASASLDETVRVWELRASQGALTLKGHAGPVQSVCFSPDGQRLASASADRTVKVWDARTGQEALALKGHTSGVTSVCFSPDGQRLASASMDSTVKVWDARTGQETLTLKGQRGLATSVCICFSPDGQRLASASTDKTVKVRDARTGQEVLSLKLNTSGATSVCFSPDGRRLASACMDETVKVWDAHTGEEVLVLSRKGHTNIVASVCFSPDGQRLASASGDQTVKVWDARTGQETFTLKGHAGPVQSVCFSPDGQRLASASEDGRVKVWDARTGQESLTLKGHAGPVQSVCFSPDGQRLASASWDQTVKVWDARPLTTQVQPLTTQMQPSTPQMQAEREALNLVESLFNEPLLRAEVIDHLRTNKTISDPVRQRALEISERYREDPEGFNHASWTIVRRHDAQPDQYRQALRRAEMACQQAPENNMFLDTLGTAQYRTGRYPEALKTLLRAVELNHSKFPPHPATELAFLAMTEYRIGEKDKAQDYLNRLRKTMAEPGWAKNEEAQGFLREAEDLLSKPLTPLLDPGR